MKTTDEPKKPKKPYEAPRVIELGTLHTSTLHDPHCQVVPCFHHSSVGPH